MELFIILIGIGSVDRIHQGDNLSCTLVRPPTTGRPKGHLKLVVKNIFPPPASPFLVLHLLIPEVWDQTVTVMSLGDQKPGINAFNRKKKFSKADTCPPVATYGKQM